MEELKARCNQLEAENQALAAAGEEAAELAEEYHAKYARMEAFQRRRARADAAVERALREQLKLALAHRVPACCCQGEGETCAPLSEALVGVCVAAVPHDPVRTDEIARVVIAHAAARIHLKIAARLAREQNAIEVVNGARKAVHRVGVALFNDIWLKDTLNPLEKLARQARCFVAANQAMVDDDTMSLHCALLRTTSNELRKTISKVYPEDSEKKEQPRDELTVAQQLVDLVRDAQKSAPGYGTEPVLYPATSSSSSSPDILTETNARIAKLERELDEERVRSRVFEQQITHAHRIEADIKSLREQLKERDLAVQLAQDDVRAARREAAKARETLTPRSAARNQAHAQMQQSDANARQLRALRARHARLLLADLQLDIDHKENDDQVNATRRAAREALQTCRRTAANARVVQLDDSLNPMDEGATLSTCAIDQAIDVTSNAVSNITSARQLSATETISVQDDVLEKLLKSRKVYSALLH